MAVKKAARNKAKSASIKKEVVEEMIEIEASSASIVTKDSFKSKLKKPKVIVILVVVALAIAAFLLKGYFVAAMVNGEPISRLTVISELEKQGGRQALSSLVNQALILQEAKKKNVQVTQEEVDKAVKEVEDSLKTQEGQNLDDVLEAQGMTREELGEQLKLRLLVEKLLADKLKVTDKEIEEYVEKNKDIFPADMKEDEIKKSVAGQLEQQKIATESQAWLQELTENAKINYFVSY